GYPAYYMINCAHPSHFEAVLPQREPWVERIRGLRANASRMSHAELNESPALAAGDAVEPGQDYARAKRRRADPHVKGRCGGTGHGHGEHIAAAVLPLCRTA